MQVLSKPLATSLATLLAVMQAAAPAYSQAAPRRACFVFASNSFSGSGSSPAIASAEASTSQALEVLAERRESCPPGTTRSGSSCVPIQVASVQSVSLPIAPPIGTTPAPAPVVVTPTPPIDAATAPVVMPQPAQAASQPASARPKTASVAPQAAPAAVTGTPKAQPKSAGTQRPVVVKPATARPSKDPLTTYQPPQAPAEPHALERTYGAWAEAFADRERRTGSAQTTAGIVVGFDRTMIRDGATIRLGGLGTATESRRTLSSDTTANISRDVTFSPNSNLQSPSTLTFDTENRSIKAGGIRTHGVGGGLTWSVAKGNAFFDGVAKLDLFDLSSNISSSDSAGLINAGLTQIIIANSSTPEDGVEVSPGVFQGRIYFQDGSFVPFNQQDAVGCIAMGQADAGKTDVEKRALIDAKVASLFGPSPTTVARGSASLAVTTLASTYGVTYDLGDGLKFEPSISGRLVYSNVYDADPILGLQDGRSFRLEAGGKLKYSHSAGDGGQWTHAAGIYLYSDVLVRGFVTTADGASFQTDEGDIRARGLLQSRLQLPNGTSLYGELNGRIGRDYQAVGGKLGVRFEW